MAKHYIIYGATKSVAYKNVPASLVELNKNYDTGMTREEAQDLASIGLSLKLYETLKEDKESYEAILAQPLEEIKISGKDLQHSSIKLGIYTYTEGQYEELMHNHEELEKLRNNPDADWDKEFKAEEKIENEETHYVPDDVADPSLHRRLYNETHQYDGEIDN